MKEIVYIETSFVSLLVADPSRDVSIAGNQQVSRDCTPLELMGEWTYESEVEPDS